MLVDRHNWKASHSSSPYQNLPHSAIPFLQPMTSLHSIGALLLLLLSPFIAAQDLTQISIVSVTSDGSCTDTFPTVTNCRLPSTLTLSLSAPITPRSSLYLILDSGDQDADGSLSINSTFPTQAKATIRLTGFAASMMGRALSLYIYDQTSGNKSQPLVGGASLTTFPSPTLSTISGCEGSGSSTLNCIPDVNVWTFTGSGLLLFNALDNYQLQIGTSSGWVYPDTAKGLVVVNDSYAWMRINTSSSAVLAPLHFTGQLFPFSFNLPYRSTLQNRIIPYVVPSQVSVSFGSMPPPSIRSIFSQSAFFDNQPGCSPFSFSTPFTNAAFTSCLPGVSLLWITGDFLWADTITLSRADSPQDVAM